MPKLSAIERAAIEFKQELLRGEELATRRMLKLYSSVWHNLRDQLEHILLELGDDATLTEVARRQRLEALIKQTESEIAKFAKVAATDVAERQAEVIQIAQAHTAELAAKGAGKATRGATWRHLATEELQDLVGFSSDGSPLSKVFQSLVPQGGEKVRDAIVHGLAAGFTPKQISKKVRDELGGNAARALTIARTEDMRAYRTSSLRSMRENDHVVQGWIWHASLSFSTCAACLAKHGSFHKLDEAMGAHPNCRCIQIPSTHNSPLEVESGEDWLRSQDEETQRRTLSPEKYRRWKSGEITLSDLVAERHSKEWGLTVYEKPLKDL